MRLRLKALMILVLLLPILTAAQAIRGYGEEATNSVDAIERYRKGDVVLRLLDDVGRPISGASIIYKQTNRDFLFGIASGGVPLSSLQEAGINYVEVYASWKATQYPGAGALGTAYLAAMRNLGFVLSGHCLVWMVGSYPSIPGADPWNLPYEVKTLKYEQLKEELYDHVYMTVNEYKSFIKYWDINEPFWRYGDPFNLNSAQWIEIIRLSVDAIKKADPEAKIYMNNLIGDFPTLGYYPISNMKLLMDMDIDFDAIGLELYGDNRSPGVPLSGNYPELSWVSDRLDQFGKLGKPIILTEVGVTTVPNQKAQAEWLKRAYTIAFGKPYIKGVAWTFALDDPFLPNGGLFEQSGQPRQSFYALKNLTDSWLTEGSGTTDGEGALRFRGFAGNYSIRVTTDGIEPFETAIYLQEQVENQFEISMPKKTTPTTATVTSSILQSSVTSSNASSLPQQEVYAVGIAVLASCLMIVLGVKRLRRKTR